MCLFEHTLQAQQLVETQWTPIGPDMLLTGYLPAAGGLWGLHQNLTSRDEAPPPLAPGNSLPPPAQQQQQQLQEQQQSPAAQQQSPADRQQQRQQGQQQGQQPGQQEQNAAAQQRKLGQRRRFDQVRAVHLCCLVPTLMPAGWLERQGF